MGDFNRHVGHLLFAAIRALGSWAGGAGTGCAGGFGTPPGLFFLHRDLATGSLLSNRLADYRRLDAIFNECSGGPDLVRLFVPANGLDRFVHVGGAGC